MDLSGISTEDLQAIQSGKFDKVSTPGLQAYQAAKQHQAQAEQQSQHPQQIPDPADKASQDGTTPPTNLSTGQDSPLKQYLSAGKTAVSALMSKGDQMYDQMGFPGYGSKMGEQLNAQGGGAVAGEAAAGALTGALGKLGQLGGWAGRGLARMTAPQAEVYTANPTAVGKIAEMLQDQSQTPALQDMAVKAINNSRTALKTQGLAYARQLGDVLSNKYVEVNPQELQQVVGEVKGIDPRADEILTHYEAGHPVNYNGIGDTTTASAVSMPANEANALKRYLQEGAKFGQQSITQPVAPAQLQSAARAANGLRTAIEDVSPQAAQLNQSMQESMILQNALKKGLSKPIATVSSQSPDTIATLSRAGNRGAGGLLDLGNQIGAAKTMAAPDVGSGVPAFLSKMLGRGIMQASTKVGAAEVPPGLASLFATQSANDQ